VSFQIDCGFKGFHSAGSYHLVSEQGFQSGLILSFLVCLFDSRHSSRVPKKKKKKNVAAKFHCSSVCVGLNLLLKSLCWMKLLVLEFVLVEISYSRVCVGLNFLF
jgi:hypothetical protein